MTVLAYIGLGANLGDTQNTLIHALTSIAALPDTAVLASSSFYQSAPVQADGPDYVNAVAKVRTDLAARALMQALQHIEQQYGRVRPYRNAPRTLDLDILLYGHDTVNDADLIIPHPRMHERAFVLMPLSELYPELTLPQGNIAQLLTRCENQRISKVPN